MLVRKEDVELQKRYFLPILKKSIFIHPTDTHYAIGCDATNPRLVMKLRLIKRWQTQPFSVIAPSKQWIVDNLHVPEDALNHIPGPVTIMAHIKNLDCVAQEVHLGTGVLGVKYPGHWITDIIGKVGVPVVSSCANKYAEDLMTSLENADPQLVAAAQVILHEGAKRGRQPVFIDFTESMLITQ